MLDFLNNHEVQETIQQRDFFTTNASERLYIDMRNSLGCTSKKEPMKRDDSSIKVEILLRDATKYDLDVTVVGQGFSEFVYESEKMEICCRCTNTWLKVYLCNCPLLLVVFPPFIFSVQKTNYTHD